MTFNKLKLEKSYFILIQTSVAQLVAHWLAVPEMQEQTQPGAT